MHAKSLQSCLILCNPMDCMEEPAKLLCPWDSPGKNTGVGCRALLQETVPTQGLILHLVLGRQVLKRRATREARLCPWLTLNSIRVVLRHLGGDQREEERLPEQMTPASSWWPQLCSDQPEWAHWPRWRSAPAHCRLSRKMSPEPGPKWAFPRADMARPHPSCRHTTSASFRSHRSSHTVPQAPRCRTSTRPEQCPEPPTSRSSGQSPADRGACESPGDRWRPTGPRPQRPAGRCGCAGMPLS